MELRHLRYFEAVGRAEHFGRAAKQLRIAQPALTRQIRDLEAELGIDLFERLSRGVRLSDAGRLFLEDASAILVQVDRAVEQARSLGTGHLGTVRVGFSELAASHEFIAQGLLHFRQTEPGVALKFRSMASLLQIEAMRESKIDAAIVYDAHVGEQDLRLFDQAEIGRSEIVAAVYRGHPLAERDDLTASDLADQPFLWPSRATAPGYYDRLMAGSFAAGLSPRIVQETVTNSIMLSLISVGMGVGLVPATTQLAPSGAVRLIPIRGFGVAFRVLLLWRRGNTSPALRRFVDVIRAHDQATAADSR